MKTPLVTLSSIRAASVSTFLCLISFGLCGHLAAQSTLNFEAESLAYTGSGATASVQTDANSSGGHWVMLAGNSVGDHIDFTVPAVPAGTYQLKMEWKGLGSRGILQLAVDGSNLGATLDQYSASAVYPTTTFGNVTFASTGNHTIRLTVTGKNAKSSNYQLAADKFTLIGQAISAAAAPVFNPAGGSYSSPQQVTITSATSGASIRYTTDGSTPSETAGTVYSGPVDISSTATLKAIAYASGFADSSVTTANYTISTGGGGGGGTTVSFEAENLSYTPSGATASAQTDANSSGGHWVLLSGNSVGDNITFSIPTVQAGTYSLQMEWKGLGSRGILQFAVDGTNLGPTLDQYSSSATYPTTTFGTVTFASAGTHTIRLTVTGKNSASSGYGLSADKFVFTATGGGGGGGGTVAAPTFNPAAGTYSSAQSVTITSATGGASIRYTTDGSAPSETAGTLYSGPVSISATTTLKAIAYAAGMTDSSVTSGSYTISTGGGGGGNVTFENNGTKEGWPNYPQTPQAHGTITDVSSPTYHSTSAIEFTQTFVPGYTGRYHSEVDLEGAQQTNQDRYYGMTFFLPAGWQYANDQVNVQQWAGTGPWIIFRIDGPDIIVLFDHLPDGFFDEPHIFRNVPSGVWTRVVTHIRSSSSGGIWECWINGNHVYSHTGNLNAPGNGGAIRWSTGCYVSGWFQKSSPQGPSERIVYGTHYRVATTYNLAEPANW